VPTKRNLLFLAHRTPWPLNKGEKIRAGNAILHLSQRFNVHLGCLVDDPADLAALDGLRPFCAQIGAFPVTRRGQMRGALLRARPGRPLMPDFYRHAGLRAWVGRTLAAAAFDVVYIYTVAMAPYVLGRRWPAAAPRLVLDAVDIDSEKWRDYAQTAGLPMRLVWARESRTLLAYERHAAAACDATLFVSAAEAARFAELAPEVADRVSYVENGVDLDRFSPALAFDNPMGAAPAFVFTGTMDYWPNADAVIWFAREILPLLRARVAGAAFWIVGANPTPAVQALAALPGVHVTGRVADTRPYVAHAVACVCPLRIARGIQNKVLEGMAMGRPVVASPAAFEGVQAVAGQDLLVAEGAAGFAEACAAVAAGAHAGLGGRARAAMANHYAWPEVLARLDRYLD